MNEGTIGIVGAGLMGLGIAQVMAMGGRDVLINDVSDETLRSSPERLERALSNTAELGLMEPSGVPLAAARIRTTRDRSELAGQADLIVEAIPEDLDVKRRVFRDLEQITAEKTILASNTSSIPPDDIAVSLERPERFLVTHFFNPPYLVPLVEVVPGSDTDSTVIEAVSDLLEDIGNAPVVLRKAVPGFLINRLQIALLREALSLVQKGVASVEDVDRAVRNSIGRRLSIAGVFEVCDLSGLDVVAATAETVLDDLDCSKQLSDLIRQRTSEGNLGAKTGRGFYSWDEQSIQKIQSCIAAALAAIRRFPHSDRRV